MSLRQPYVELWFDFHILFSPWLNHHVGLIDYEVEVVDESPPSSFNPPLTNLDTLILIQVRELFSEPFYLFSDPHTMSGPSVSSSVSEPSSPSTSKTAGILVMSTLPSLSAIGPIQTMLVSTGPSIWGILVMSSFSSISIPNIPMPIPLVMMSTLGSHSSGGASLGFNMGGGIPSTSTIPMSGPTSSGVGLPFGWNIPSGFGTDPSQYGGRNMLGGFNFPWVSTPLPDGNFP